MQTVYMVGHSNHPIEAFLALLTKHGIERLIDVRSRPASRFSPQFNAKALGESCRAAGIAYIPVPALGGMPCGSTGVVMGSTIPLLEGGVRLAFMCSEGNHLDCHRHYHLAPVFVRHLGLKVLQILRGGELVEDDGTGVEPVAGTKKPKTKSHGHDSRPASSSRIAANATDLWHH